MKLWFKIFISSLFLVVAAINITAIVILANNQSLVISRERSRAQSSHEFICASIANNITYERLKSDAFMLTKSDIDRVIEKVISQQLEDGSIAIIYDNNDTALYFGDEKPNIDALFDSMKDENDITSMIIDYNEKSYLFVGSKSKFEGESYTIFTANNISEVYEERDRELVFVQIISFVFASIIAVILLIIIKILFRPLGRINTSINEIANGDYSRRLETKGSEEFSKLSQNINAMAISVEENYNKIESIAEDRKRFIDSLSHEMKTPLTSILGFADILRIKRNITPDELNEYATIIVEESKRLRALSGKLMELVSSGNSTLEFKPTQTDVILNELKIVFEPIVKAKKLELKCNFESTVVNTDSDIFKSLVYNLLDNAVKASYDGGVIELSCKADGDYAVITVQDYGVGISDEDKKRVFEPFYMADKARSRKMGGTGLGLSLCSEIAKKHNAVIELKSELSKGTKISVRIKRIRGENE